METIGIALVDCQCIRLMRGQAAGKGPASTTFEREMKIVAENHALSPRNPGDLDAASADDGLLTQIGDDLRTLYRDVTDVEQPAELVELARMIDALRCGSGAAG